MDCGFEARCGGSLTAILASLIVGGDVAGALSISELEKGPPACFGGSGGGIRAYF